MKRIMVSDTPDSSHPLTGEKEATEFMGRKLTPLCLQNNSAHKGIQCLDRASYRLAVDGQVNNPLSLSYAELQTYPQISRLVELDCVEGWNYTAKWTGPALSTILEDAQVKPSANIVIFHTADAPEGFSSLDLDYIFNSETILALKDNDITLPADKGFPFQVVSSGKFKWAKWVTRIELSSDISYRGSSESNAYNTVFCNCSPSEPWWKPWWPWKNS